MTYAKLWPDWIIQIKLEPKEFSPKFICEPTLYKVWDEITYSFLNFNGGTFEVKFYPTLYWACDYLSMLGLKLIHVSKSGPS